METLLLQWVVFLPLLLLGLSVHEASHAFAAWRLGDPTAKQAGRLTLYPPRHIDLFGSVLLPMILLALPLGFTFGWAKPTPVDPGKLGHPKRDYSLVALAGPLSNLALALLFALAVKAGGSALAMGPLGMLLGAGIFINVMLGWFNLLPLPGLDGLKACYAFLPDEWCWRLSRSEPMFLFLLLVLMYLGLFGWAFAPIRVISQALCQWSGAACP